MEILILIARILLSIVFLVAGLAKLADRAGSRRSMVAFGVPETAAGTLGVLLPVGELLVALFLLPVALARVGAAGALLLLLTFCSAIAYNLAVGRKPDCHCFGQLHSAPAGWPTLCRNVILAAVAGFIEIGGRGHGGLAFGDVLTSFRASDSFIFAAQMAELAVIAAMGFFLFQIIRQNGRLLLRVGALESRAAGPMAGPESEIGVAGPGLLVGTMAPLFRLASTDGQMISNDALLQRRRPLILVFVNPGCGPCQALLPKVAQFQRDYANKVSVAVISEGSLEDNLAKIGNTGLSRVLLQEKREVSESYIAHGTPAAVMIEVDGRIGSPLAFGADAIQLLFTQMAGRAAPVPASRAIEEKPKSDAQVARLTQGDRMPTLPLRDLQGRVIKDSDFRDHNTLLIFWNPDCGYCQKMLTDLRAFEESKSEGAPEILLISSGSTEANRAMNLRSRILLDLGFHTGASFGAHGTPMGVLIDGEGKIATGVVAGGVALMEMAKSAVGDRSLQVGAGN